MSGVDLELKKHFEELQVQMAETKNKMRKIDVQIEALKKTCQHSHLTKKELMALPEEIGTYESLGRMFVQTNMVKAINMINDKIKTSEERITSLEANKQQLEKSLKERENNLRELINHKQKSV